MYTREINFPSHLQAQTTILWVQYVDQSEVVLQKPEGRIHELLYEWYLICTFGGKLELL